MKIGNKGERRMKMRIDYHDKFREEPLRAMLALEKYVHECGLDGKLLELVKMRASQINGCAYLPGHAFERRECWARPSSGFMR